MNDCLICQSEYKQAIDDMLQSNASYKYIQSWCKERNLKLTQRKIKDHLTKHTKFIEKSEVNLSNIDSLYLNRQEIIDIFNLTEEEFDSHFSNKSKDRKSDGYNVLPMMINTIKGLDQELKQLYYELQDVSNLELKSNLETLKVDKLNAQVRFQEAVANLRHIDLQEKTGILVSVKDLDEKWSYSMVKFKSKLESIPNKLALQLLSIEDIEAIEEILLNEIYESLEELKDES